MTSKLVCPYCGGTAGHSAYQVGESQWLWSCPTWTAAGQLRWGSFKTSDAEERLAAVKAVCDKWAEEGGIYRSHIIPELRAALTGRVLCQECGHLSDDKHECEKLGWHP